MDVLGPVLAIAINKERKGCEFDAERQKVVQVQSR